MIDHKQRARRLRIGLAAVVTRRLPGTQGHITWIFDNVG